MAGVKKFSLAAQMFAVWSAGKFGKAAVSETLVEFRIADVIVSAFTIVVCFSITMDKVKSIRFGDEK